MKYPQNVPGITPASPPPAMLRGSLYEAFID